ncbi:MAG: biopolymer transporter ExbD [Candidatus Omnitrophota bacterium]
MHFKGRMVVERGLKPIDIVPFINIMLLLLIFFMLTPDFLTQPALKMNLPKSFTSEAMEKGNNIEISIDAAGAAYINGHIADKEGLQRFFSGLANRKPSLVIKADTNVSLGALTGLWDMARSHGITQINIATVNQK